MKYLIPNVSSEINTNFNNIQSLMKGNGEHLPQLSNNADLNSLSDGSYIIDLEGHDTIRNLPNNDWWFYGRLVQYTTKSGTICQELWYDNNEYGNCVYNRVHGGRGWSKWKSSVAESESYKGKIPNSDLDKDTTPGTYHIDNINCQNSPDVKLGYKYPDWGTLKVLDINTNGLGQLYYASYGANSMTIAFRAMGHGRWLPWNIIANDTDIQNLQREKANKSDLRALSDNLNINISQINNRLKDIQNNINKINNKIGL